MLATLLYVLLVLIILNIMFSFVPIDSRLAAVIMILVILFLFFNRPRYWGANLPPPTQDVVGEVQHELYRGCQTDQREAG